MSDIVIADNDQPTNMMVDLEITKQQMKDFAKFKKEILDKSDIALVKIGGVNRPIIKKSGWRKIQTACRLTYRIIDRQITNTPEYISAIITTEVTAPAGRIGQGIGACDSNEKQSSRQLHDIVSTAATRSLNRTISDFVAMGELVYAEIEGRPAEELNPTETAPTDDNSNCNCGNPYLGKSGAHCANCDKELSNTQRNYAIDEGKTYEFWLKYCSCRAPDIESKDCLKCDKCRKDLRPETKKILEYKRSQLA